MKRAVSPIKSSVLAFALFAGVLAGCGGKEPQPTPDPTPNPATVAVTGVSLNKTSLSLVEGTSETLTATVSPENASNKSVSWKSSAADVATVDENGKVTAVKAGSATVTVTTADGGKTATCSITVTEAVRIVITGNTAQVPVQGGMAEFPIQYNTSYTVEIEQSAKEWLHFVQTRAMRSGTLVFSIDANTGDARTGKATVKADDGKVEPITLTFEQNPFIAVSSVQVTPETADLVIGKTLTLTVTVLPEDATDKTVTWTCDNETVVTVTEEGVVMGKAAGTATITATSAEKTASCFVMVRPPVYETERAALEAFYRANNGDHWTHRENWCSDLPLDEWYGITTSPDGHVNGIRLWDRNIRGCIPKEIGDLAELETFSISAGESSAAEYGPLPRELGKLEKLKVFCLQGYSFEGDFPDFLYDMTELEELIITYPLFIRPSALSPRIGNLKKLRTLQLSNVNLPGSIPAEIGELRDLETLRLEGNNLTGEIPASFGNLMNLDHISLNVNSLSGVLPPSMHKLDKFWKLWPGIVIGNDYTLEQLRESAVPAPKSPALTTLTGQTLKLEDEFSKNQYTLLYDMADSYSGNVENLNKLETLYKDYKEKGLGIITYIDNNGETEAERSKQTEEFRQALEKSNAEWSSSFVRYFLLDYPEGTAPFYTESGYTTYPYAVNNLVIVGPENTIVYSSLINGGYGGGDMVENAISFLEKELGSPIPRYESSDYAEDGKVRTLQQATAGNGIDLVITGDAFSDRLIADGTFEALARNAMENLFSREPLQSLRNRFNVYLVNAISRNEEYFNGNSTVFSGSYGGGSAVGGDNGTVLQYVRKAVDETRMDNVTILVMMNTGSSGGTCYMLAPEKENVYAGGASIAWVPYNNPSVETGAMSVANRLVHELGGHGVGKLADEYYYQDMGIIPQNVVEDALKKQELGWYRNVDFTDDPSKVLWCRFVGDSRYAEEGIGVYEGGYVYRYGVWRPTDQSVMFMDYTYPDFNAPSRAQIYTRIMKLSEGQDWQFDYETFVKWDQAHPTKLSAAPATRSNYVEIVDDENASHVPPVILNKIWRQVIRR